MTTAVTVVALVSTVTVVTVTAAIPFMTVVTVTGGAIEIVSLEALTTSAIDSTALPQPK